MTRALVLGIGRRGLDILVDVGARAVEDIVTAEGTSQGDGSL
jgi:hypothetical protein